MYSFSKLSSPISPRGAKTVDHQAINQDYTTMFEVGRMLGQCVWIRRSFFVPCGLLSAFSAISLIEAPLPTCLR